MALATVPSHSSTAVTSRPKLERLPSALTQLIPGGAMDMATALAELGVTEATLDAEIA